MRVFVTGATGYIGSAVVNELIGAGHTVVGLTRSDQGAEALKEAGAEAYLGTLDDLDGLRAAAAAADGVIHLAFQHNFSDFAAALAIDLRASARWDRRAEKTESSHDLSTPCCASGGGGRAWAVTGGVRRR